MDYKFLQNDPEIGMKMVFAYVSMSDVENFTSLKDCKNKMMYP